MLDHSVYLLLVSDILPTPIFNVDPYYPGKDATVEHNIDTGVGRGILFRDQEFGITIPSHNGQKFHLVL